MIKPVYTTAPSFANHTLMKSVRKLTDEGALELLRIKLLKAMSPDEVATCIGKVKKVCQYNDIRPRDLPISKEFPGSLTKEQKGTVFSQLI